MLLLGVATLGNVAAVTVLIRWGRTNGDSLAVGFYASSLLIVFGLAWAAASLEQTIQTQWGEQLMSTASQGLFLAATVRLARLVTMPQNAGGRTDADHHSPTIAL